MKQAIDFAIWITGHDKETVEQMYNDWQAGEDIKRMKEMYAKLKKKDGGDYHEHSI